MIQTALLITTSILGTFLNHTLDIVSKFNRSVIAIMAWDLAVCLIASHFLSITGIEMLAIIFHWGLIGVL